MPNKEKLYTTLVDADLVKFAKALPLPAENDNNLNTCIEFVRMTKPVVDLREEMDKTETEKMEEKT